MPTVVIPAHNEATVIDSCLRTLLADSTPDAFAVIVACNGCTDDTAARSRAYSDRVKQFVVLEVEQASKIAALNAAIAVVTATPVVFLDADVEMTANDVAALCAALGEDILAASPSIRLDSTGANALSRSYHRFWEQLPSIANGLAGRGVYALSAAALDRLGAFPDIVADDRYVHLLFLPRERVTVRSATSTVAMAQTARDLIHRKARVFAGNKALRDIASQPMDGNWTHVLRSNPGSVLDLPAYLGINLLAKRKSRVTTGWNRDESSRD